jgi:hypothetical protein
MHSSNALQLRKHPVDNNNFESDTTATLTKRREFFLSFIPKAARSSWKDNRQGASFSCVRAGLKNP